MAFEISGTGFVASGRVETAEPTTNRSRWIERISRQISGSLQRDRASPMTVLSSSMAPYASTRASAFEICSPPPRVRYPRIAFARRYRRLPTGFPSVVVHVHIIRSGVSFKDSAGISAPMATPAARNITPIRAMST